MPDDRRRLLLRAALGFLQLAPTEPELHLLHRWLDNWTGVGLITVGVERRGMRLSLSCGVGSWGFPRRERPGVASYVAETGPTGEAIAAGWR